MHGLRDKPHVIDIRNLGLAGGLTLAADPEGPGRRGQALFLAAYEEGLSIRANGDTIAIAPILTSRPEDLEDIFARLGRAFARLG